MDIRTTSAAAIGHPLRRRMRGDTDRTAVRSDEDLKLFAVSFTAFFICFYTFLI